VTFILKPAKASYTEAKAYHPISLLSLLLKTMEQLVDGYIRGDVMRIQPLHRNQFTYQAGRSTETAPHNIVMQSENAVAYKETALETFLDIDKTFDTTSFSVITEAVEWHGVEPTIIRWINSMLESRSIIATLSGETFEVPATRGYPQGGMLLPLLWSLVVDGLLRELDKGGYYAEGYAMISQS
jgi:hypothetical protein